MVWHLWYQGRRTGEGNVVDFKHSVCPRNQVSIEHLHIHHLVKHRMSCPVLPHLRARCTYVRLRTHNDLTKLDLATCTLVKAVHSVP